MDTPNTHSVSFDTIAGSMIEQARTPEQKNKLERALVLEETKAKLDELRGQEFSEEALKHIPELLEVLEQYEVEQFSDVLQAFFYSLRAKEHTVWTHFWEKVKKDGVSRVVTSGAMASTLAGSVSDYVRGKRLESEITSAEQEQVYQGVLKGLRAWAVAQGISEAEAAQMEFTNSFATFSEGEQKLWRETVLTPLQFGKTPEQVIQELLTKKGKEEVRKQILLEGTTVKKKQFTFAEVV